MRWLFSIFTGFVVLGSMDASPASACPVQPDENTPVVIVGVYEGSGPAVPSPRGHADKLRTVLLTGRSQGGPVALVLNSYNEVQWQIGDKIRHRVKGIVAYGYHEVSVTGAANNTLISMSYAEKPKRDYPCGFYPGSPTKGGQELEIVYEKTKMLFGKPAEKFIGRYRTSRIDIDERIDRTKYPCGRILVEQPIDSTPIPLEQLPKRKKGIKALLDRGHIRRATQRDVKIWARQATASLKSRHLAGLEMPKYSPSSTYVAQTKINIPEGLTGGHSISLIIPLGVPEPNYTKSHNDYLFEKDGKCVGICTLFK